MSAPPLEAVAPAVWAAHRQELEARQAEGWRFRLSSSGKAYVAERGGTRCYSPSVARLLAHLRTQHPSDSERTP